MSEPHGEVRRFEIVTQRITAFFATIFVLGVLFVVVLHLFLRNACFNLKICT